MKITTILLLAFAITAKAQTKPKEYAKPEPNKQYTFTLTMQASKLNDLAQLVQGGSMAIMDTDIQAKLAKAMTTNSFDILSQLGAQLRKQIVADSLANVKKGGKP